MILCVGATPTMQRTMMFARLRLDGVNRAREVIESASGKSINVARVLATLGEVCTASGFLGGDSGKFIRADLDQARVPHDFVEVRRHTRTCTTIIDESSGGVTELIEESKEVAPEAWAQLKQKIDGLLKSAGPLVLSGSLPPGAPVDFYAWCVGRANASNVSAIVDASAEPLARAIRERPFIVKPNRMELSQALGMEIQTERQLREGMSQAVEMGARWIVVTMGRVGSRICDGRRFWKVESPDIEVVSAIGSGDAYAGGLAAALARGESMPDAARLGAACAAANAMIPIAGYVRKQDVEQVLVRTRLIGM
jgi:1-phosphofructokinase family hexose kinase